MLANIYRKFVFFILLAYSVLRGVADLMGIAELFDDPAKPLSLAERALNWLFLTPWWVPAGVLAAWALFALFLARERPHTGLPLAKEPEASTPVLTLSDGQPMAPPSRKPAPNIRLDDVLRRITGLSTFPGSNAPGSMVIRRACDTLREKALLQEILVWGGLNWRTAKPADWDNLIRAPIPAEYWRNHKIDVIDFLGEDGEGDHRGRTTDLVGTWGNPKDYYGIWFDRNDIDALQRINNAYAETGLVPLQEAVKELFDEARKNVVIGMTVTRKTEDEKCDWLASVLWGKVPLQVRFQISNKFEPLTKAQQRERYVRFRGGKPALFYDYMGVEQVAAREIAVLRSDLDRAIGQFKEEA